MGGDMDPAAKHGMTQQRSSASAVLTGGGTILIGLGLYFLFMRPPLLPEDPRYMGTTLAQIRAEVPGLLLWLPHVFTVMGGYMVSTGILTCYIARTSFRDCAPGAAGIVVLTGVTSIGLMTAVNFVIDSDFKWLLLLCTAPWVIALSLFQRENKWIPPRSG